MAALKLNRFSQQIADALFERFPEWLNYARVDEYERGDEGGILYVEIPAPSSSKPGPSVNHRGFLLKFARDHRRDPAPAALAWR